MSKPDINVVLEAANPVTEAAVEGMELGTAERDLIAAIAVELRKDPAAPPTSRPVHRRRRSSGVAIIVFAGLALAGSAMAATGVWNPLSGGWNPLANLSLAVRPTQTGDAARPQAPSGRGAVIPSGAPRKATHRRPMAIDHGTELNTPGVSPVVPEDPVVHHSPGAHHDPGKADGGQTGDVGGGNSVDAPHEGGSPPKGGGETGGGGKEQPGGENPGPHASRTSLVCAPEQAAVGQVVQCHITVSGEVAAPTGQIYFKSAGPGSPLSSYCDLSVEGGTTSSCDVPYTPSEIGAHQMAAFYSGDAANTNSSANFTLNVS